MKHYYFSLFLVIFCFSCSKTEPISGPGPSDPDDTGADLKACFSLSKTTLQVGEALAVTNCSKGAMAYSYEFGNGSQSTDASPLISYQSAGEFTITLTVTDGEDGSHTTSRQVLVNDSESYYLYPEVAEGYSYLPLETGYNPQSGKVYVIELREDLVGPGGTKFHFKELDASYAATVHYIADKPFESGSAFVNFLAGGNRNFHFSRTLTGLYGSQELTYNASWGFLSNVNPANRHSYGFLPAGSGYVYFGTAEDGDRYKAALELRNSIGDPYQEDLYELGPDSSVILDMIQTETGYAAFAARFIRNATAPHITGYTPVLAYFDPEFTLTSVKVLASSGPGPQISSPNELNGSYHLERLSNGNLILYGNAELFVTDPAGTLITRKYYEDTGRIQGLVALGDSFVISTRNYLRKFDANGTLLKEIQYNGQHLPEILLRDGKLFFVSGYETEDGIKIFYGRADTNLELLPLTPEGPV